MLASAVVETARQGPGIGNRIIWLGPIVDNGAHSYPRQMTAKYSRGMLPARVRNSPVADQAGKVSRRSTTFRACLVESQRFVSGLPPSCFQLGGTCIARGGCFGRSVAPKQLGAGQPDAHKVW
jgi:hypothetical protein